MLFSQNNGKNSRDLHAAINLHAIHGCDVITDSQKKNCCTGIPLKFFTPIMKMNTKEDIHKAHTRGKLPVKRYLLILTLINC